MPSTENPLKQTFKPANLPALRFCAASIYVYATVAFAEGSLYDVLGRAGAYALWTTLFILLGSFALIPAVFTQTRTRFTLLFALAFLAYAIGWIVAYFTLRGSIGEWVGSLARCLMMAFVFAAGFFRLNRTHSVFAALFLTNSVVYFLGSLLNHTFGGRPGMLL